MKPHSLIQICITTFTLTACDAQDNKKPEASKPSTPPVATESNTNAQKPEDDEVLRFMNVAQGWMKTWAERQSNAGTAFTNSSNSGDQHMARGYELLMKSSVTLMNECPVMSKMEQLAELVTDKGKQTVARGIMVQYYKNIITNTVSQARKAFTVVSTDFENTGMDDGHLVKKLFVDLLEQFTKEFLEVRLAKWEKN